MSFWNKVELASGIGSSYLPSVAAGIVLALLLAAARPATRSRMRYIVLLLLASLIAVLVGASVLSQQVADAPTVLFQCIRFAAELGCGLAAVELAGTLVFNIVLPGLGVIPAPILFDATVGFAYLAAVLFLLGHNGVNLSGIVATSAVLTGIIGFSMQDTLSNLVGGISLQAERTISVGDWVRVGAYEGVVRETRWRQTSIETRDWSTVVIPNSLLTKSAVTVLGRRAENPRLHRVSVTFDVESRHSPDTIIDVVEQAVRSGEIVDVAPSPLPCCILAGFENGQAGYLLFFWTSNIAGVQSASAVRSRILVALQRAEIDLSLPVQQNLLTFDSRARKAWLEQQETERRVASMENVELFSVLTDDERLDLAAALKAAPFRRGEIISRQGEAADYLYILTSGEANVRVAGADGASAPVAGLGAGDVFGEMGMMTGQPRTATVQAVTEVMCYRLDRAVFKTTLQRRPELAEAIGALLAKRKVELDGIVNGTEDGAAHPQTAQTQGDLVRRIRQFFLLA